MEDTTSWNPQGLSRALMGLLYLYLRIVTDNEKNTCCDIIKMDGLINNI
jgi:hypothetical protein